MSIIPGEAYLQRKAAFDRCLTVYGRNPVLEALQAPGVVCERLHLARSNKPAPAIEQIEALAREQRAEVLLHGRAELARISRNAREDQGVAADLRWPGYRQLADILPLSPLEGRALLAVDGITNPQNLGMLIRSAAAGACEGILLPRHGGCDIGPLVIKASAGALFRATLLRCERLPAALGQLRDCGWKICVLDGAAPRSLFGELDDVARVYVLGSESTGVSSTVQALADERLAIPMNNGVESLNVAGSAALVVFRAQLRGLPSGSGRPLHPRDP
ncbi:MAG: RNA methyltransferase [Gammaproteobacteria bacterium]|nr:RNA methyltransferase [Gammaproteobacteria bacterium]